MPPFESDSIDEESRGGILILGGKKIVYYELESVEAQRKLKGKASRTEKKKKNTNDTSEVAKAEEKEKERELRKRKPKMSVEWPWSDIGAWTRVGEYGSVKYLIGDNYGRLAMMTIGANEERRLTLVALGEVRGGHLPGSFENNDFADIPCYYFNVSYISNSIRRLSWRRLTDYPNKPVPCVIP